jgi:BlaI family transcriptional regulator, penicillinase repressor
LAERAPSERELELLKALGELGEGSVRDVRARLHPRGEAHFNTVQTLLRIMEEKGLVGHRAEGRAFVYFPKHSRGKVTRRFLHKVFDGDIERMVLSLLGAECASADELKGLNRLIAKARCAKPPREGEGQ